MLDADFAAGGVDNETTAITILLLSYIYFV